MEITKNVFAKGLNSDLNSSFTPTESYLSAHNLSLVDNGNFFALQNIKGTTNVAELLSASDAQVLGVFSARFLIGTTQDVPCLVIFTAQPNLYFKIWCYDTQNDVVYEMYQRAVGSTYLTDDRIIDAVLYPENGIDYIYFTDNNTEIGKLRCEIPTPYSANFLSDFDISLGRRGALGTIAFSNVTYDGSLFTGSYQFAYQMVDPSSNKYSKWSTLSNPFVVFKDSSVDLFDSPYAGYGLGSNKSIVLTITPTAAELANYTHFRLAVVENIFPESTLNTNASITDIRPVSDLSGSIKFSANLQNNLITLAELVTDVAAIASVKTLEIRRNRLLAGNITYKDLPYDNGTPDLDGGSIVKYTSGTTNKTDLERSTKVGYFRGELYRFAISYFDEYGNYSKPSVLNMAPVNHNQASGSTPDFRFPRRNQNISGTRYPILEINQPSQLGLSLVGVDRHPTWAKGFIILRALRKKNVLFQAPMLPMMPIYGPGAIQDYPSRAREDGSFVNYTTAQPMGPSTTFVPMNLFWPKLRKMVKTTTSGGSGTTRKMKGEVVMTNNYDASINMIFPPASMYTQNSKYTFSASHTLESVDAALLKLKLTNHDTTVSTGDLGNDINTNVSGTFYALNSDQYYYDDAFTAKASLRTFTVNSFEYFDNLSEGKTINGKDVMVYSNLETDGIKWGEATSPNVQRCAVIEISGTDIKPINTTTGVSGAVDNLTFAAGSAQTGTRDNGTYQASTSVNFYTGSGYVNTVEIVNCVAGLNDTRYGASNAQLEFIQTGTKVVFTAGELVTVAAGGSLPKTVEVWGGDCVVSPHIFKISDTTFSLPNQTKFLTSAVGISVATLDDRWGRSFKLDQDNSSLALPIPLKGVAQYLQVYLESEYDGEIMDINPLSKDSSTAGSTSRNGVLYNNSEFQVKTPLTYNFNVNTSKSNDQKLFFSDDPLVADVTRLKSRIIYSDLKVYQSNIEGFDVFRVLNYHDLPETYGGITKLIAAGDNLYGIQEFATNYIGLGERVLETTDASLLAVQSGDIVGNVILIDNRRGSQHLKTVLNSGNVVFFADNHNKTINKLIGQDLQIISDSGQSSQFRTVFSSKIAEKNLVGVYDPIKKEYWIGKNASSPFCLVWNDGLGVWTSNYEFAESNLAGSAYINQKLYLSGKQGNNIQVHEMYTGASTSLFGSLVTPRVTFVVNPNPENAKRFDDVLINSSDRLSALNIIVEREAALGTQTATGINLATISSRGEGNFRAKILRDADNARLRGLNAKFTISWLSASPGTQVSLVSTSTTFTPSARI